MKVLCHRGHKALIGVTLSVIVATVSVIGAQEKPDTGAEPATSNASPGSSKTEYIRKLNLEGIELAEKKRYAEALEKFETAARIQDAESSHSYNNMGYAYELQKKYDKAISAYEKAVARNPSLIPSLQNLGRLYYQKQQYIRAVEMGDRTIKIDPENKPVMNWLPDAYVKAAEMRKKQLEEKKKEVLITTDKKSEDCEPEEDEKGMFIAGLEVSGIARQNKNTNITEIHKQAGLTQVPAKVYLSYHVPQKFEVYFSAGTPYLGLAHPGFLSGQEKISFVLQAGSFYYGAGALFTQADMSYDNIPRTGKFINNTDVTSISDTKLGFILGNRTDAGNFKFEFFPRYLFRDQSTGPQNIALDYVHIGIEYTTNTFNMRQSNVKEASEWPVHFLFSFIIDEAYLMEYKIPSSGNTVGHYFGTYDISFGVEFGRLTRDPQGKKTTFTILLTERIYLQDLNDTNPLAFANGQGYFGIDSDTSDPFSGFRSNAHILSFESKQLWSDSLITKEKFSIEMTSDGERDHALQLDLGVSYIF